MVDLVLAGMVLAFVGIGMMVASVISQGRKAGGAVKGGGVVMIGPIPIIFGTDSKWASIAMVLAIVLILLALIAGVA